MSHFDLYAGNFPRERCLKDLKLNPLAWDRSPRITTKDSPHREAWDIILRGPRGYHDGRDLFELYQETECYDFPMSALMPNCIQAAEAIAGVLGHRQLGRVILTKLEPEHCIWPHCDEGPVPEFYNRFHCVIQAGAADMFMVEDECKRLEDGQVWKIDVTKLHTAANMDSKQDRIHMIVDVAK